MKKTPSWVVGLMFFFLMWLFMSTCGSCFGQRINGPDTFRASFLYVDTSCHFRDIDKTYNNRCIKEVEGYIVYWMYFTEFLDKNKKPFTRIPEMYLDKIIQ